MTNLLNNVNLKDMTKQQKEVKEAIRKQAELIMKEKGTKGHTNVTYEQGVKDCELLLTSLCEMYKIAYS